MSITYPLFVFEKDDCSMRLIREEAGILHGLEAIDIQNDEYVFWDANGADVAISASVGSFKSKLTSIVSCPPVFPISEAFTQYAKSLGIAGPVAEGAALDVWNRIQSEVERRPRKNNFFSRLFPH